MTAVEDIYTFIGVTAQDRAVFMDIAALRSDREALRHCEELLATHDSGALVELWRGAGLVAKVYRGGDQCARAQ